MSDDHRTRGKEMPTLLLSPHFTGLNFHLKIMYNYFKITLSFFILLFPTLQAVTTEPHHTTAFIAPPGEIDLLISDAYYTTNHFWNKSGKLLPTYNQFKSNSTLLYIEYAINNSNSLTLDGGYSMVQESLNGNSCGWEDVELGWKTMLYHSRNQVITAQIIAIIPAGNRKSSIRYGQGGVQGSLLYSDLFLLFEREGWVDLDVGYRVYDGFPSDQIVLNLAAGYKLFKCVTVIATGELLYAVNNGHSEGNFNNVIYNPNPRLLNGKIECLASITSYLYLTIGLNKHIWGQNVGAGGGCYAGIWISY